MTYIIQKFYNTLMAKEERFWPGPCDHEPDFPVAAEDARFYELITAGQIGTRTMSLAEVQVDAGRAEIINQAESEDIDTEL